MRPLPGKAAAILAACALHLVPALGAGAEAGLSGSAAAPEEGRRFDSPAAVVRELFVRYAAGDLRGAAELWVAGPPAEEFVRRHRPRLEKRCLQLESLTIDAVSGDPPVIDATSAFTLRTAAPASTSWRESSRSRFVLQRDGDGWRVASWQPREKELVDALVAAAPAGRQGLVDAAPELHTTTFSRLASQAAVMLNNLGRNHDSVAIAELGRAVAERLGDPAAMSVNMSAGAAPLASLGQLNPSISLAEEALVLAEGGGDPDVLARALVRLNRATERRDGLPSIELGERALALAAEVEELSIIAHAVTHLGRGYELRGRYREAFRYADLAVRLAEESGDRPALMGALTFLEGAYIWIGDRATAGRHRHRAAMLARDAGFEPLAASAAAGSAGELAARGKPTEAFRLLNAELERAKDPQAVGLLLHARATLHRDLGHFEEAERDLEDAAAATPPDPSALPKLEWSRALLAQLRGDLEGALAHYEAMRGPNAVFDRTARHNQAELLFQLGRLDEARALIEEVAAEDATAPLVDPQRSLFHRVPRSPERLLVEARVAAGETAAAFRAADQMKAKELADAVARGKSQPAAALHPQQPGERALTEKMQELNRGLASGKISGTAAADARKELAAARAELVDLRQRQFARRGNTTAWESAELCLDDLPAELDHVTIVSYVVRDRTTLIFVLEPKRNGRRELTVHSVEVNSRDLLRQTAQLTTFIEQRNLRVSDVAADTYELLLRPIEPFLRTARSLCIIPDTALWRVPFHSLGPRDGPPLLERLPLFYAPSLSVLALVDRAVDRERPEGGKPRLLAFANPRVAGGTASLYRAFDPDAPLGALPETESEVRSIARMYGSERSRIYIGEHARETTLKQEAAGFDVLHIATHGIHVNTPMFSSLLLAAAPDDREDGVLEALEISALGLDADLVVLSACDSGRSDTVNGSAVVGLSWAFLAAGSPTTVVSQWKAHSAAAAILMVEFHRQLFRGHSKPEALRRAQLALRRDHRYRHPFYWAPFVVIGMP